MRGRLTNSDATNGDFTDGCEGAGEVIIPNSEGVRYSINDTNVGTGKHVYTTGESVIVSATAEAGFTLKEGAITEWKHTFTAPESCVLNGSTTTTPPSTVPPQMLSTSTTTPSDLPVTGSRDVVTIAGISVMAVLAAAMGLVARKLFVRLS